MDSTQIRTTFLDFYTSHGHRPIEGSTLLPPPYDPVLYTTSGMHPLTPYFEGRPHPDGTRLVNLQRCLRTTDLDEVGDDTHLTVFGMLGSWSLGDYDGDQSLRWGYELLTDGFGIDPRLLHVTVFGGEMNLRIPHAGHLWVSPSLIKLRNPWALANSGIEIMHSLAGGSA